MPAVRVIGKNPMIPMNHRHTIKNTLLITSTLACLHPSEVRADDHSGIFSGATPISALLPNSRDFAGRLDVSGDVDMFRFTITKETMVRLYTTGGTDTYMALYNASGTRITYDYSGGDGYNAEIFLNGADRLTPGTYYVQIQAGGVNSQPQTGAYTLSIRTESNAMPFSTPDVNASLAVAGEVDFYRFEITAETMLSLYTTGSTDTYLALYGPNGALITYDYSGGSEYNASIFLNGADNLTPGTYYVAVRSGGVNSQPQTGPYTLSVRTQVNAVPFNTSNLNASLGVAGDVDLFRFQIKEETLAWLYTTGTTDTYLSLYDSNGVRITYDYNGGSGYNASIFLNGSDRLLPGTYYVAVRAGGVSSQPQTGPYTLSVRTKTNAMPFNGADLNSTLGVAGDVDLYRIDVTTGGLGYFLTTGNTDTDLILYDSNGTFIAQDNHGGAGYNAYLASILESGVYYLRVRSGEASSQPQTGAYRLSLRLPGNAEAITKTGKLARSISVKGDLDYYVFSTKGGTVDFQTSGRTDTSGYLYSAKGQFISSDHSSGSNGNFRIRTKLAKGTYYLAIVGDPYDTATGKYTLRSEFPANPFTIPTVDAVTAGGLPNTFTIAVRSNTTWTVGETLDWLSVSPLKGQGNGTVKVLVSANPGIARSGYIRIGGKPVMVRQLAAMPAKTPDWNGNGVPDLMVRNSATRETATWMLEGAKIAASNIAPAPALDGAWEPVNQGDFNKDGSPDQVWQNRDNGQISVRLYHGTTPGEIKPLAMQPDSASWKVVATGDFLNTGSLDIVLQDQESGKLKLWILDSGLKVTDSRDFSHQPQGAKWKVVAAGDATGDGFRDLVFQHENGLLHLWILRGLDLVASGAFTLQPAAHTWQACGMADLNDDGMDDLVLQHAVTGKVMVWYLDGRVVTRGESLANQPAGLDWEVRNSRAW